MSARHRPGTAPSTGSTARELARPVLPLGQALLLAAAAGPVLDAAFPDLGWWPLALPGVLLAVALVSTVIQVESNQLSRAVERSADGFALALTGEPETQIAFQRKIAIKNVSDPDPPDWVTFLLGTHPPTIERIGQAEAAARAAHCPESPPRADRPKSIASQTSTPQATSAASAPRPSRRSRGWKERLGLAARRAPRRVRALIRQSCAKNIRH